MKGTTEDEMVGWHHRFNGHEFEQTLGDGEGQGSLWSMGSQRVRNNSTILPTTPFLVIQNLLGEFLRKMPPSWESGALGSSLAQSLSHYFTFGKSPLLGLSHPILLNQGTGLDEL